jgi:hypothetical protein
MPARRRRPPMQVRRRAACSRRLWRPTGPDLSGLAGTVYMVQGPGPPAVDATAAPAHVNAHRRPSETVNDRSRSKTVRVIDIPTSWA